MIYGYCRISTPKQSIERQIRNIRMAYPDAILYQEKFTGTTLDRPEWRKLKRKLCSGDMVVYDSVSRMSRDAQEGVALYRELYNEGIELAFLREPHIDTAVFREAAKRAVPMCILRRSTAALRSQRSADYVLIFGFITTV